MAGRVIPKPYDYPAEPHVRRHGPGGWKDYRRYRPWLRDEFTFRCVYCLERETWHDMRGRMHIDHFQPQALRKDLECEYTNLLYLCPACNNQKRDLILPDPCTAALGDYLCVHEDGRIEARNVDGERLIDILALNDPRTQTRRRIVIDIVRSLAETNWLTFMEWMGFPADLPDLTAESAPSNSRPEGVNACYFAQRQRGELSQCY